MSEKRAVVVPILGLLAGCAIAFVDSRPSWNDTGISAAVVFLMAAILGALRPGAFLVVGLAIGLPVVAANVFIHSNFGSALALGVAVFGAGSGALLSRVFGFDGFSRKGA